VDQFADQILAESAAESGSAKLLVAKDLPQLMPWVCGDLSATAYPAKNVQTAEIAGLGGGNGCSDALNRVSLGVKRIERGD
jgi:hypothetical protein